MNYYEIFDLVEDECVDILPNDNLPDDFDDIFTAENTKKMVFDKINTLNNSQTRRKKLTPKKLIIISIAAALLISGTVIAKPYWKLWQEGGAEEIANDNRELIGKEVWTDAFVTTSEEYENYLKHPPIYKLPENDIVKSIEGDVLGPNSVNIFPTSEKDNQFLSPEVIMMNNALVVFTTTDSIGWKLKKGDIINFEAELYPTYGHSTSIFCILPIIDGELKEDMEIFNANKVSYHYTITEDCYYNLGILSASPSTISFHEGTISIISGQGTSD